MSCRRPERGSGSGSRSQLLVPATTEHSAHRNGDCQGRRDGEALTGGPRRVPALRRQCPADRPRRSRDPPDRRGHAPHAVERGHAVEQSERAEDAPAIVYQPPLSSYPSSGASEGWVGGSRWRCAGQWCWWRWRVGEVVAVVVGVAGVAVSGRGDPGQGAVLVRDDCPTGLFFELVVWAAEAVQVGRVITASAAASRARSEGIGP
jgi:hypothetical protein